MTQAPIVDTTGVVEITAHKRPLVTAERFLRDVLRAADGIDHFEIREILSAVEEFHANRVRVTLLCTQPAVRQRKNAEDYLRKVKRIGEALVAYNTVVPGDTVGLFRGWVE